MRSTTVLCLVSALSLAPSVSARTPVPNRVVQRSRPTLLTAARPSKADVQEQSDMAVAGRLAGLALGSEVVQYANTAIGLFALRRLSGVQTMADVLELLIGAFGGLGWSAYPLYAALLVMLQVVPVFSALILIILAGALFGPLWGTVLVSVSLSCAALMCALITRAVCARTGYDLSRVSSKGAAVDAALAAGPVRTQLLLLLLLRLSPVLPFTFSNYLFGLTSLHGWVIFLGTLLGTLPSQMVYVSAGALGRQALQGGLHMPPSVLVVGAVATVAAIWMVGHISKQTLDKMNLEGM